MEWRFKHVHIDLIGPIIKHLKVQLDKSEFLRNEVIYLGKTLTQRVKGLNLMTENL